MSDTKRCPYCAEDIRVAAVRCPHCRSRLRSFERAQWHRSHSDARLAGVAAALARALSVPLGLVRLGFVVLTLVQLLGPLLYGALWLAIPEAPGGHSKLEQILEAAQRMAHRAAGRAASDGGSADGSVNAGPVVDGGNGER